ncbi:dipeptidase [Paenibacillus filicis]|uniref:Dipeptidase n=1 Tax=Paenibacillus gyeongsangnamensis TaxID=3388067 RepID=A0ABT4Q5Y5_9BACL|nr:dipeptidase [Paenibacillus filicis]MCZ8512289.1 dipeptidase [Paenibacillus filicis]
MQIIDGHCDVLYKMYEHPEIDFFDPQPAKLDVSYAGMVKAGIKVQCFAIYLPERITQPQFDHYLEYVDIFFRRIVSDPRIRHIKTRTDLEAVMNGKQVGALLTLEGTDALRGNSLYLRIMHDLGVRLIGTTWNHANWAADGVMEPRQGGFTRRGKRFIKECCDLGILLDVSHLTERAFWDLAETADKPFIASHSNVLALCGHPRNLNDAQIRELIRRDGRIGITFVPYFVRAASQGNATIDDVLRHVEYLCAMGAQHQITFGSDFDGIQQWIPGLEKAEQYVNLVHALQRRYPEELVRRFMYGNWYSFLQKRLPVQ